MTVTKGDVQALTWLATRLREDTHGCGHWDAQGTYAVISEHIGHNLAETLHCVVGHALDPEARTPGAIRRPFIPKRPEEPGRRQPAKAGEDCRRHPGEYVGSCRACRVDGLGTEHDVVLADQDRSAGRRLREQLRARRLGVTPEAPASDECAPDCQPITNPCSRDDRPETACAAPGCFRPTRDGICDRCRAAAAAEAMQAANAELIDRLHANEAERARNRPPVDPAPPRYFTSADYDPERVHAAQAQRTETYWAAKTALNGADHE